MTAEKDKDFLDGEVWAAALLPARNEFAASVQRKSTGSEAGATNEYVHFAGLDFTNMGR